MKRSILFIALYGALALSVGLYIGHARANGEDPSERQNSVFIAADQNRGTITFIIGGQPVAQINRDGLHVVDNINYGGVLTDTGSTHVRKMIVQEPEKQAGENGR